MEQKFWVVVNFQSRHWLMHQTKKWINLESAQAEAARLAEKHREHTYTILEALMTFNEQRPPIVATNLVEKPPQKPSAISQELFEIPPDNEDID